MKRLGIIQPGKIGDIVICLPIAKWYYDKGYEIIWPVDRNIISHFKDRVDYVTFVSIDFDCRIAHQICFNQNCNKIIDISFTIPGASLFNSDNYLEQTRYSFDEFKYFLAGVPFENKWNLQITRNLEKEEALLQKLVKTDKFVVISTKTSDGNRDDVQYHGDLELVVMNPITDSVFDWILVLERAEKHFIVDSCFVNIIEQLDISPKDSRYLLLRNGYYGSKLDDGYWKGKPRVRKDWIEV
jgi:hypothetical protein